MYLSILALLLYITNAKSLPVNQVVMAMDCGSFKRYKSSSGIIYQPDSDYSYGSKVSDYSTNPQLTNIKIQNTNDTKIFISERHSDSSFHYELTISKPGLYVLILQFIELHFQSPGKRVFNVKFGDYTVIPNLDIFSKVGNAVALEEYLEFELKEDEIFFNHELCPNAYKFQSKKLVLGFEKGSQDLPKVDGLILFKGSLEETNYNEVLENRRYWHNKLIKQEEMEEARINATKSTKETGKENDDNSGEIRKTLSVALFTGPGLIFLIFVLIYVLFVVVLGVEQDTPKQMFRAARLKKE